MTRRLQISPHRYSPWERILPDERMFPAYDWRTGIIKEVYIGHVEVGDPDLFHVSVINAHINRLIGIKEEIDLRAAGSGLTLGDAFNRAMGEVLERYASCFYDHEHIIVDTCNGMKARGLRALSSDEVWFFDEAQYQQPDFPFKPFTDETPIGWVEGVSLLDGEPFYVPAQMVYFGYVNQAEEVNITYATSSGCACSPTTCEALLKSIYEQVERDAVMSTWYAKVSELPRLRLRSSDALYQTLVTRNFFDGNMKPELRLLPTELPFTIFMGIAEILAGLHRRSFVGAAGRQDPAQAAFKALLEIGQGVPFIRSILIDQPTIDTATRYDNFDSNLRFYAEAANMSRLNFLKASSEEVTLDDLPNYATGNTGQDLQRAVQGLAKAQMTPVAFDLTTDDVKQMGYQVCRVIVPELNQLGTPAYPFLGNPRIWDLPHKLGLSCLPKGELNPDIHPFP